LRKRQIALDNMLTVYVPEHLYVLLYLVHAAYNAFLGDLSE